MSPWDIAMEALARMKPPRGQKWLAEQLDASIAVVNNWKERGIPARRYRDVATALNLTIEQLEGLEPLPWEKPAEWPFEDRGLFDRVRSLKTEHRQELQGVLRKMVMDFEQQSTNEHRQETMTRDDERIAQHVIRRTPAPALPQKHRGRK